MALVLEPIGMQLLFLQGSKLLNFPKLVGDSESVHLLPQRCWAGGVLDGIPTLASKSSTT